MIGQQPKKIIYGEQQQMDDETLQVLYLDKQVSDHVLLDGTYQVHLNGIDYLRYGVNIGDEVFLNVL
jgi:hypothetical protein